MDERQRWPTPWGRLRRASVTWRSKPQISKAGPGQIPAAWARPRPAGSPPSLRRFGPHAGQRRTVEEIRAVITTLPDFYDAFEPRLAHGDFVPVNVLLAADGSLAAVLDLGSWRIAHPWLDLAWWGVVVTTFHHEAWVSAWPGLLAAAGVPDDDEATTTIARLQLLRSLESAATRNDPASLRLLGTAVGRQVGP